MPDNVVIKFESDITGLAPAYEALLRIGKITEDDVKAFEKATVAQKDLAATAAKGVSSFDKLADATSNVKKNIIDGSTNRAIEGTNKIVEEGTKKTNEQKEAIKAQKAEIKDLTEYIKTLQKESAKAAPGQIKSDINKKINEAKYSLSELNKELKRLETESPKSIKPAEDAVKVYDTSIKGLRQQYKDLISLAIQSGEESPIGQQALQDAGELRDRIGDLMQTTQNYASDTATFDAISQGIGTIGAGFEAAEGAQALFGEGNEDLQKSLVRLQAIMALTNGLQTIQNNLQAESALRLRLASIQQVIYTTVVGTSTGAMKAFRIALAATGIGALVLGLIALITNFDSVTSSVSNFLNKFESLRPVIETVTRGFQRLKDALGFGDKLSKQLKEVEDYLNSVLSSQEKYQKRELELRKSKDQNTLSLERETNKILMKEQAILLEAQKEQLMAKARETGKVDEDAKKALLENITNYAEKVTELTVRNNDIEYEIMQRGLQARKNQIDARLQFAKKGSEEELKLKLNQIAAELAIENSQRDKIEGQVALNEAKANVARKQAFEDYKAFQIQGQIDTENKKLTIVQAGSMQELNIRKNLLKLDNELTANNSKLSQTQKELKLAENAQKELDLIKKFGQAQITLAEQIETKKQNVGNDRLQKYQDQLNAEYQYYNEIADLEFQSGFQTYNRIENLRREKFKRNSELLDSELAKVEQTNENIRVSEEKLQRDLEDKANADPANRGQYELAILESQDRIKTSEQKTADEIVKINREKNLLIQTNDNETEANKKANLLKQVDLYKDLANESADFLKQANDLELEQNLQKIQTESDYNQQNLDAKLINESEYARKKKILDDKAQQEKIKSAKREKSIQSVMTIVNTASSIIKTGAELGYPAAIPFQILAGAVGALQLAAINNIKIPEFAKGTNFAPKGWAWVGENGPELVNLRGGEQIKTAEQSKSFAQKHFEMEYFSNKTISGSIDTSAVLSPKGKEATKIFNTKSGFTLDYKELSKMISQGVGEKLQNLPFTKLNIDKNGFNLSVIEGSNKTHYMDNRYSTN